MLAIALLTSALSAAVADCTRHPHTPGYSHRYLLQAFPAGLDEASIVNSALQLQRTTCASTSNCIAGADCVSGVCSCRSPYVETDGQCKSFCDNNSPQLCRGRCYSASATHLCDSDCGGTLCLNGGTCTTSQDGATRCGPPLSCPSGQQSCQTSASSATCQTVTAGTCGPGCFGACPSGTSCQYASGGCSSSTASPTTPPPGPATNSPPPSPYLDSPSPSPYLVSPPPPPYVSPLSPPPPLSSTPPSPGTSLSPSPASQSTASAQNTSSPSPAAPLGSTGTGTDGITAANTNTGASDTAPTNAGNPSAAGVATTRSTSTVAQPGGLIQPTLSNGLLLQNPVVSTPTVTTPTAVVGTPTVTGTTTPSAVTVTPTVGGNAAALSAAPVVTSGGTTGAAVASNGGTVRTIAG